MLNPGQMTFNNRPEEQTPQPNTTDQENNNLPPTIQKLQTMAEKLSHPLLKTSTVFPLVLFPTALTVDLRKITINRQPLPASHVIETLPLENLTDVSVETSLIAATVRFMQKSGEEIKVKFLPVNDGYQLKRIVLGLITCIKEGIKLGELDPEKDLDKIIAVGEGHTS
jgi:hypothetical protein